MNKSVNYKTNKINGQLEIAFYLYPTTISKYHYFNFAGTLFL